MSHDGLERLEEQWKRWAKRPPATPASQAAYRLVARLDDGERRIAATPRRCPPRGIKGGRLCPPRGIKGGRLWALAAVAVVVVLAVGLTFHEPPMPSGVDPVPAGTVVERPPLKEGVVLLWLNPDTPLYLTVRPPAPKGNPK